MHMYTPSYVLLCLLGVTEETYEFGEEKGTFKIVDVGGQRCERKKWLNCFDAVTAVIFIASLNCYDEILFEDHSINSMTDQLDLFDDICNQPVLCKVNFMLKLISVRQPHQ